MSASSSSTLLGAGTAAGTAAAGAATAPAPSARALARADLLALGVAHPEPIAARRGGRSRSRTPHHRHLRGKSKQGGAGAPLPPRWKPFSRLTWQEKLALEEVDRVRVSEALAQGPPRGRRPPHDSRGRIRADVALQDYVPPTPKYTTGVRGRDPTR
jgi:hypothetical protein